MDVEYCPSSHFTEPAPLDFNDHEAYVPLFDGVSLKGWDGNPKFWRVEGGAIVGESTTNNPCGNTYLVYRDMKTKEFTLKFEMKIVGKGGQRISKPQSNRNSLARPGKARGEGKHRAI
jgi:hypothetical protein